MVVNEAATTNSITQRSRSTTADAPNHNQLSVHEAPTTRQLKQSQYLAPGDNHKSSSTSVNQQQQAAPINNSHSTSLLTVAFKSQQQQ